jgi:hypothetical protein
MDVPLYRLKDWAPFHLDALGLVTLLGAEEVSTAIGALEHSLFTECLPLFGTYLIAGNRFTRPIPGFALYNVSDGVYIPIVNGWFARWLIANLTDQITTLEWEAKREKRSILAKEIFAVILGFIANGGLITIAALQGDFYGLVNAIAMALSVIVRLTMVHQNRKHLNKLVDSYLELMHKPDRSAEEEQKAQSWETLVNIIITAPEDKVVAFKIPRGLLGCIISDLDVVGKAIKEVPKEVPEEVTLSDDCIQQPESDASPDTDPELALKALSSQITSMPSEPAIHVSPKASGASPSGKKASDRAAL